VGDPAYSDISFGNILQFSPDGKLLATDSGSGVQLWKVTARHQLQPGPALTVPGNSSTVYSVDFSPDSKTLATGHDDGTARLWDMATATSRQVGGVAPRHMAPTNTWAAFTADGKTLATLNSRGMVQEWDVATGRHTGETITVPYVS